MRLATRAPGTPAAVVLTPRHAGHALPPFEPGDPPPGGWTLPAAVAVAWAYARAHELGRTGAYRAFAVLAEREHPRPDGYPQGAYWLPRLARERVHARLIGPDPFDAARLAPAPGTGTGTTNEGAPSL